MFGSFFFYRLIVRKAKRRGIKRVAEGGQRRRGVRMCFWWFVVAVLVCRWWESVNVFRVFCVFLSSLPSCGFGAGVGGGARSLWRSFVLLSFRV